MVHYYEMIFIYTGDIASTFFATLDSEYLWRSDIGITLIYISSSMEKFSKSNEIKQSNFII